MSWSFYQTVKARELAGLARATADNPALKLSDEKEEHTRQGSLEIVALVADSHDGDQLIRCEAFGYMAKFGDKPATYSVKILVEPAAQG